MSRKDRTAEELKALAIDRLAGKMVTDRDVPTHLLKMVFMPLCFTDRATLRNWRRHPPALIYGVIGKHWTAGRSVNGYPMFAAFELLNQRELKKLNTWIEKLQST